MSAETINLVLVIAGQVVSAAWVVAGIRADIREVMVRLKEVERRVDVLEKVRPT